MATASRAGETNGTRIEDVVPSRRPAEGPVPLRTVVHFRTGGGRYCVPVEAALAVRSAAGLVPLPAPRPGVLGILPAEEPITVLSVLGSGGDHVLVLASEGQTFGLLVEEVTGLSRIDDAEITVAPEGQDEELISGVISRDGGLVLIADPAALRKRLDHDL